MAMLARTSEVTRLREEPMARVLAGWAAKAATSYAKSAPIYAKKYTEPGRPKRDALFFLCWMTSRSTAARAWGQMMGS